MANLLYLLYAMCTATQRQRSKKRLGRALESSPFHRADFRDIFFKRFRESDVRTSVNKDSCIVSKRKHNVLVLKKREKVDIGDVEREDKISIRADHEQPHYSEMLLDDPDALKTWLTDYLQPMCDADPAALSKYVIALIKKEKPLAELRSSMQQQMEVFLQSDTPQFIASLFDAIDSKDYMNSGSAPKRIKREEVSGDEEAAAKGEAEAEANKEPPTGASAEQDKSASSATAADSTTPTRAEDNAEGREASTAAARDRGRSERQQHHSRSRYGSSRRSRSPPHGRNRLGRRLGSPPPNRPRYRSRSPPHASAAGMAPGGYRSRSPYGHRRSRRRSPRSYSPPPPRRRADSRGSTPTKDEAAAAGEVPPYLPSTVTVVTKRPRCRDYDEKGFCMRGDQCKFDHGSDAVVLEDSTTPYTPAFPPGVPQAAQSGADPYVPSGMPPLPPLHVPPPGYAVPPVLPVPNPRKRPFDGGIRGSMGAHPRGGFRGSFRGRGGHRMPPPQLAVRNIPPHVNNIAHLNNHFARFGALINVQVQFEGDPASALVTFANPMEAEAAHSAPDAVLGNRFIKMFFHYDRNAKSVRDRLGGHGHLNQGIKTAEGEDEGGEAGKAKKEEEKAQAIAEIKKSQDILGAKVQLKKDAEAKRIERVKKSSEIAKSKQSLLENYIGEQKKIIALMEERKETMTAAEKASMMDMLKLLSSKIETAKEEVGQAVALATKPGGVAELQKELLDAELELMQAKNDGSDSVGELQKRVNELRFEATKINNRGGGRGHTRGYSSHRGYHDAPRGGGYAPRGYGGARGRGFSPRGRGRGRGYFAQMTTVDRRPCKIAVTGFEDGERDEVVAHMAKFGELVEASEDEASGALVVHFKNRRAAEVAMGRAALFGQDRELQLAWFTSPSADESVSGGGNTSVASGAGGDGNISGAGSSIDGGAGDDDLSGGVDGDLIDYEDDGYVAPNMSYVPEGLDEHEVTGGGEGGGEGDKSGSNDDEEDILLKGDDVEDEEEGEGAGDDSFEGNAEALLEEEDEEDGDEERSWKR